MIDSSLPEGGGRSVSRTLLLEISGLDAQGRMAFIDRAYREQAIKEQSPDIFYRMATAIISETYLEPAIRQGLLPTPEAARNAFRDYAFLWLTCRQESISEDMDHVSKAELRGVRTELLFHTIFAALRAGGLPITAVAASADQDIHGEDVAADILLYQGLNGDNEWITEDLIQLTGSRSLEKFLQYNQYKLIVVSPHLFFTSNEEQTAYEWIASLSGKVQSDFVDDVETQIDKSINQFAELAPRLEWYLQERPDIAWVLEMIERDQEEG